MFVIGFLLIAATNGNVAYQLACCQLGGAAKRRTTARAAPIPDHPGIGLGPGARQREQEREEAR
jgi:hypothetical protein